MMNAATPSWEDDIFDAFKSAGVSQVPYVPDAGHAHLIRRVHADPAMTPLVLTTEEEGVASCCGAWLGGKKSVLLMQSSGVGNCVNMLSLVTNCNFPFLTIVSMRGEYGEFNSWQVPMARATQTSFEMMGVEVMRCNSPDEVGPTVDAALYSVFASEQKIAILLSQRLIGRKVW
jgi:sulfopyruvate decarboxylase alpha subunit